MFHMFGSNAVWQIPSKNGAIFCNEDRAFFSAETPVSDGGDGVA